MKFMLGPTLVVGGVASLLTVTAIQSPEFFPMSKAALQTTTAVIYHTLDITMHADTGGKATTNPPSSSEQQSVHLVRGDNGRLYYVSNSS